MGELRPIGLFAFSCLIACLTQALPTWLILFSIAGICLKFWRGLKMPAVLLYTLMILFWCLLIFDSPKLLHRDTLTGALVLGSLFSILSPPHNHRIMRFHVGLFGLLISILIVPKETFPLPVYFGICIVICMSLVLHHVPNQSMFSLLNLGRTLVKLALPLGLLLVPVYYFFPEIRTPMPQQSMSGISGDLEPGQLASLALSDRLAFRVRFLKEVPADSLLYWRAEVLETSRGMSWTQGEAGKSEPIILSEPTEPIVYELMLDFQLGSMLPLLEHTTSLSQARDESSLFMQREKKVVKSSNRFIVGGATPASRFRALSPPLLEVPDIEISPRVEAIVTELKTLGPREQIQHLLGLYKTFKYTLEPGRLTSPDPLDQFLFETKKGFCEHFAASFATLLRLAGTPARIVIGYQGAHQLGSSLYYQVTNANAHAWTEVWIDGQWIRVDPSTVVMTPESRRKDNDGLTSLITAWISFTIQHTIEIFQEWSDDIGTFWVSVGICATGLLLIQIWRLRRRKDEVPEWERKTQKLLHLIEQKAKPRDVSETVYNYLGRMSRDYGIEEFQELAQLYNHCKFAEDETAKPKILTCLTRCKARLSDLKNREPSRYNRAA